MDDMKSVWLCRVMVLPFLCPLVLLATFFTSHSLTPKVENAERSLYFAAFFIAAHTHSYSLYCIGRTVEAARLC